jgi:2-methylisocitrate lyase-like PEP mutase family enzyme
MTKTAALRALLAREAITTLPGCWDALSARMIERAGFPAAFMSGYAVSAARIGQPDAGLISYAEMLSAGRDICAATTIPIIGDADTGFGNPANVRRAVQGYAQAGFACVMIEDQVFPKRCGYAQGLAVAPRAEVRARLQAALDARDELRAEGRDILVIGRTDARPAEGLEEALWRAECFSGMGADIVYFEGPQSEAEMVELNRRVTTPTMLAQIEKPGRPWLSAAQAEALGYKLLLLGVTLLNATIRAQQDALAQIAERGAAERLVPFDTLYETVGFEDYYAIERRYLA